MKYSNLLLAIFLMVLGQGLRAQTADQLRAKGDAASLTRLGVYHCMGCQGAELDSARAFALFQQAADLGSAEAQVHLAGFHLKGSATPKDTARAVQLVTQAAQQGNGYALARLATYHEKGTGLPRDKAKAADLYRQAEKTGDAYALYVCFIRAYKGLDLLLEAMGDERMKRLGVRLIVAGEFYGDPKPYMEQIARLGIEERVILRTDFIPDAEVNRYFRACHLIAQPYKTATQSGVTQIGFHFERPMLVTNVGGLSEVIPHLKAGYCVEPQPQEIADAIVDYFENQREEALTQGVKEEKTKYSWERLTAAIERISA